MAEADRITQVKEYAKIIKEPDRRDAAKEDIIQKIISIEETAESIVVSYPETHTSEPATSTLIVYTSIGFILGVLVTSLL